MAEQAKPRNPLGLYLQEEVDPSHPNYRRQRPNLPEERQLVIMLGRTLDAFSAVRDRHGRDCDCDFCFELRGSRYMLEFTESAVSGNLLIVKEQDETDCPLCGQEWTDEEDKPTVPMPTASKMSSGWVRRVALYIGLGVRYPGTLSDGFRLPNLM